MSQVEKRYLRKKNLHTEGRNVEPPWGDEWGLTLRTCVQQRHLSSVFAQSLWGVVLLLVSWFTAKAPQARSLCVLERITILLLQA